MTRQFSTFHIECVCGAEIVSRTNEAKCGMCGEVVRISWPAQLEQVKVALEKQAA